MKTKKKNWFLRFIESLDDNTKSMIKSNQITIDHQIINNDNYFTLWQ